MFGNSLQGVLAVSTTAATTTGTSEETIATYTLPANALRTNGQSLRIRAWGTTAATANNKTQKLLLGSATLVSTGAIAANAKDWFLEAIVVRDGAASQVCLGNGQANDAVVVCDYTAPTQDLTTALAITVKATDATAAAGTLLKGFMVEMLQNA